MELVAHRGCADHAPENTARAVAAAADRLPAVEVDLRRCGSGELVCVHDERVDDVTDGTGRVDDLDWNTLRRLRVGDSEEPVARFTEILTTAPESITLQIELKESGLSADVRRVLESHDRTDFRISSFSPPALAEIHQSDWTPETGLLFRTDPTANLALARSLDCQNVHPHTSLCLETDVVDRAHESGFRVVAWGLSDPTGVAALADRDVDGVTTDTWDVPGRNSTESAQFE